MTPDQITMAHALNRCGLFPGSSVKRFARDMASLATTNPAHELTPPQHKYLCDSVVRHRRQMAREVLAIAIQLTPHGPPAPVERPHG